MPATRGRGRSRRSTRNGGTFASATSGGSAKPNSSSTPVANAFSAGIIVGSGSVSTNALDSSAASNCWPSSAPTTPSALLAMPSAVNWTMNSDSVRADRRAEAAEHRRRVEMPPQIARCRERDRNRRQQHGDERRQTEEALGALERLPHFGPQIADRFDALPGGRRTGEPRAEALDLAGLALGNQQPPRRTIARLQQIRRGHVVEVEQQLRTRRERQSGDLGILRDDGADGQRRVADGDCVPLVARRRSASRVSIQASPRPGMPCASWRSTPPGSTSAIAPRNGYRRQRPSRPSARPAPIHRRTPAPCC